MGEKRALACAGAASRDGGDGDAADFNVPALAKTLKDPDNNLGLVGKIFPKVVQGALDKVQV